MSVNYRVLDREGMFPSFMRIRVSLLLRKWDYDLWIFESFLLSFLFKGWVKTVSEVKGTVWSRFWLKRVLSSVCVNYMEIVSVEGPYQ